MTGGCPYSVENGASSFGFGNSAACVSRALPNRSARLRAYAAGFVKLTLETGDSRAGRTAAVGSALAVGGFAALTVGLALWNLTVALAVAGVILMGVGVLLSFAKETPDVNSGSPFRPDEGSP